MVYTFTDPSPVVVGQATKKSFWDKVYDNTFYLRDATATLVTAMTAAPSTARPILWLSSQHVAVGNVGAGLDDLMTYTLPAGTLATDGRVIRVTAWGTAPSTAGIKTLSMAFGSDIMVGIIAASDGVIDWKMDAMIIRTGAATQKSICNLAVTGGRTTLPAVQYYAPTQTLANSLVIKCQAAATNNNDIVQHGMIVELI